MFSNYQLIYISAFMYGHHTQTTPYFCIIELNNRSLPKASFLIFRWKYSNFLTINLLRVIGFLVPCKREFFDSCYRFHNGIMGSKNEVKSSLNKPPYDIRKCIYCCLYIYILVLWGMQWGCIAVSFFTELIFVQWMRKTWHFYACTPSVVSFLPV